MLQIRRKIKVEVLLEQCLHLVFLMENLSIQPDAETYVTSHYNRFNQFEHIAKHLGSQNLLNTTLKQSNTLSCNPNPYR